jgi:NADH:ubiquinone oxidoreductase subunit E
MTEKKPAPAVNYKQIDKIIAGYQGQRWALIPLVQEIQEKVGYIPPDIIPRIAGTLGLFPSQVQGVVTFYSQLYTHPRGRNIVRVCRGTACHVRGGKSILKLVKQHLNLEEGETSEDMEYTLETVACIGVCALAPNMMINKDTYGNLNPKKVARLFGGSKKE